MLRLEFSAVDLGRVRVANAAHPLWELILSIQSLQSPKLPSRYWEWRAGVCRAGRASEENRRLLAAAAALVPASGNFPDFLTPAIEGPDVEAHLDAILSGSCGRIWTGLSAGSCRHRHGRGRCIGTAGWIRWSTCCGRLVSSWSNRHARSDIGRSKPIAPAMRGVCSTAEPIACSKICIRRFGG